MKYSFKVKVLLNAFLLLSIMSIQKNPAAQVKEGSTAPDYGPRDMFDPENRGKEYWVSKYVGETATDPKKVLILSFTSARCKACKKELPMLKELQAEYGAKGLQVLLVNIDLQEDEREDAKEYLKKQKLNFPCARTVVSKMADDYLGTAHTLPALFVIDRNMKIRKSFLGLGEKSGETDETHVKKLKESVENLVKKMVEE
jgi:thiol-disulfide isomerase/thioredoxin